MVDWLYKQHPLLADLPPVHHQWVSMNPCQSGFITYLWSLSWEKQEELVT
jgi:hypothetical protein